MVRFLPFLLIPVILFAGLWYWRSSSSSSESDLTTSGTTQEDISPVEVPKSLPGASLEDKVKNLEETITKLVAQVNNIKPGGTETKTSGSLDSRIGNVEASVTELKARVSALEKASPAPAAASAKYPLYIPLSSGGGPWTDQDWNSLAEYQVSINPDNYSGYANMQLEANLRLTEAAGTGYVRLYNVTDSSGVSSDISTTSTSFGVQASDTFRLPSGQKTYTIQVKSSQGKQLFVQSARIKVNF